MNTGWQHALKACPGMALWLMERMVDRTISHADVFDGTLNPLPDLALRDQLLQGAEGSGASSRVPLPVAGQTCSASLWPAHPVKHSSIPSWQRGKIGSG